MTFDAVPQIFTLGLIFLLAGIVKGVVGMGLPTVAMGFLGLFMPVAQAAAILTVPSLATNLWQALAGPALRGVLRRIWALQLGVVAGTLAMAAWQPWQDEATGRRLLGACLVAYGLSGLAGLRLPAVGPRAAPWWGLAAGTVTGAITAATGVFVLPAVPYLQGLALPKEQLTQALGVSFTTSTLALAAVLAWNGSLDLAASAHSLTVLVPALCGMLIGQKLRQGLSEEGFRKCLFAGLLLLGAWLALR